MLTLNANNLLFFLRKVALIVFMDISAELWIQLVVHLIICLSFGKKTYEKL
jgi:hypothetical protein